MSNAFPCQTAHAEAAPGNRLLHWQPVRVEGAMPVLLTIRSTSGAWLAIRAPQHRFADQLQEEYGLALDHAWRGGLAVTNTEVAIPLDPTRGFTDIAIGSQVVAGSFTIACAALGGGG